MSKNSIVAFMVSASLVSSFLTVRPLEGKADGCKDCLWASPGCTACAAVAGGGSWAECEPTCAGGCWVSGPCYIVLRSVIFSPAGVLATESKAPWLSLSRSFNSVGKRSAWPSPGSYQLSLFESGVSRNCAGWILATTYSSAQIATIRRNTRTVSI